MSTIWAFDLGKGSIGEAVWNTGKKQFDHVASLLIPQEFASTKEAATRRRMWRTRQAHKAREAWLDEVWSKAGLTPLVGRRVGKVDADGNWIEPKEWKKKKGTWKLQHPGDPRLEREFPAKGDSTCYTSCLLRIKLLRGEKLEEWQIYKALHSAIQKRGYGRVPWAGRDVKLNKDATPEEIEEAQKKADADLAKKDPNYKAAVEAWPHYKDTHKAAYHHPCFYDAEKQGLWSQDDPDVLHERIDHTAGSTRQVRFDREDVEKEVAELARQASKQLPKLADAFTQWKKDGWFVHRETPRKDKTFTMHAADIGQFLVHGPAGQPSADALKNFDQYLSFRKEAGIHPGSDDDWLGATAQKTPRFDNRIVNDCALLDGMQVCKVEARLDKKTGVPYPDSLLPSEVTFLMKLKNIRVRDGDGQRPLTMQEIQTILEWAEAKVKAVKSDAKHWAEKISKCFAVTAKAWGADKVLKKLDLHPLPGHEEVKAPKVEGRSRFSRPALKIIRALILSGQKPSVFLARLESGDAALLDELGLDVLIADPVQVVNGKKQKFDRQRPYVLGSQLKFLRDLAQTNDTWEGIYLPEQRMDALEAKHKDADGQVNVDKAIHELIGANNDPIVRHRLEVFHSRLLELQKRHGTPSEIVLEFVRTDFMGEDAKRDLAKFQKEREEAREESKAIMRDNQIDDRSAPLKYELLKQQGAVCLYCCEDKNRQNISMSDIGNDLVDIDHIVPRSKGGPDAMINYVLAHRSCNAKKDNRTPFEWLHSSDRWQGYLNIIDQHATTLRNKKVQLLTREDAPQLVERYTALAETAWISRLAKKIIDLRFGWKNSNDGTGDKRVTIVSGGLTGRIRRKFKLNSILNPNAESEEEAEKKNRKDNRHHALDAMVICFLPGWMRDPKKEKFFRFPDPVRQNPHGFLAREVERVMPEVLAFERAALADTTYACRWEDHHKKARKIVQRTPLFDLAMKPAAQNKKTFDLKYLEKQVQDIRELKVKKDGVLQDGPLVSAIKELLKTQPSQKDWEDFCAEYRKPRKDGGKGPRVIQVTVLAGEPTEYREMSKDKKGAWRKGGGNHQGQIIYRDSEGIPKVQPIYVHASITQELGRLKAAGCTVQGFFQSGCLVETTQPLPAAGYSMVIRNENDEKRRINAEADLPPSKLTLRNIITKDSVAELTLADNTRVVGKIDAWMRAGLRRID